MQQSVTHVITTIEMGGAEKQLLVLVEQQLRSGLRVEVIYLKGRPELEENFKTVGATVAKDFVGIPFLRQILLLRKRMKSYPTLLHAHLPRAELLCALSFSKNLFVFSRHNAEAFWPNSNRAFSILLSRFVSMRAKRGIAISQAVKDFLISNKEVRRNYPIDVILYGASIKQDLNTDQVVNFSRLMHHDSAQVKFGTIARLVPQKDFPTLLGAFANVTRTIPGAHLYVVGDGPLSSDLQELTDSLEISNSVHWLGRTKYIQEFLANLDVFVLTSVYEGFGLVLLEAMERSLPILAANNSAIPEVLGADYAGLFPTGDVVNLTHLMLTMVNLDSRKNLAKESVARLPKFDAKRMCQNITITYLAAESH